MEPRTAYLRLRLTPAERQNAESLDATVSDGVRKSISLTTEIGGLPTSPLEPRILLEFRRQLALFMQYGHAALARYRLPASNEIHADWVLSEIAESDPGLVSQIAGTIVDGDGSKDLFQSVFDRFFGSNPGREWYEISRIDLTWLEIQQRSKSTAVPPQHYVSYVWGAADRADVRERYLWHCRLFTELAAAGVDYRELFRWNEPEKMMRLIERPRLRQAFQAGRLGYEIGDPVATDRRTADPVLGETVPITSFSSGRIGADPHEAAARALAQRQGVKVAGEPK